MKKTFLSVLFTVVIFSSFSVTAFADANQTGPSASFGTLGIVSLNHGVDY